MIVWKKLNSVMFTKQNIRPFYISSFALHISSDEPEAKIYWWVKIS